MVEKKLNYEILIQDEPGSGNVQLLVKINDNIEEEEFFILFGLIEEYNMIISIKEIIEAKYEILDKMNVTEVYYPKRGIIGCVTVIEDFNKIYITYLKYYFKNKLIYFIGKQDKELQKKATIALDTIGFIISELVDNAFMYPFEKYLERHPELSEQIRDISIIEKFKSVKKADKTYQFKSTIFFEAKLTNNNKELIVGISNEADISDKTLEMIKKRVSDQLFIPEIFNQSNYKHPFKETSGLGLSMISTMLANMNGKIESFYDEKVGRLVVEFSVPLE